MLDRRPVLRSVLLAPALVSALALFAACGSESEEERAARAAQELASAREEVKRAGEDLGAKEAALEAASSAVAAARERVGQAEARVQTAEASDDLHVSDAALFRAVQERLLEDRALRGVAIRAVVTQGTVVLSGVVPNEKLRERAVAVASEVPGVTAVDSRIEVAPQE
jgi:osmotically-inducible protein OsmY